MFRILIRARLRMLANTARSAPRWHKLMVVWLTLFGVMIFATIGLACAALVLLMQGAAARHGALNPAAAQLTAHVYQYLFFFLLAGSVPFVASSLFQDNDLPLLLTTPVTPSAVVAAKLVDSVIANSAQFTVLGVPVLIGIGWGIGLSASGWAWFIASLALLLIFTPAFTGSLLLVLARILGVKKVRFVVMGVSVVLALGITLLAVAGTSRATQSGALDVGRMRAALSGAATATGTPAAQWSAAQTQVQALSKGQSEAGLSWLPSSWACSVAMDTAGGRPIGPAGAHGLIALVAATVVMIAFCIVVGGRVVSSEDILEQQDLNQVGRGIRRRQGAPPLGMSPAMAGLIVKDFLYIGRDTILIGQIGTTLILFFVPFVLKWTQPGASSGEDMYGNLAMLMIALVVYMVTSIIGLSTVGLEGKGAWMVLAGPLTRRDFLVAKWIVSFVMSIALVTGMVVIAALAFRWSLSLSLIAFGIFTFACFGLSGLGVGLAGIFPRFLYDNPAHRASVWAMVLGFVLATCYVVFCALLAAGVYVAFAQHLLGPPALFALAALLFIALSITTGYTPIALAAKRLGRYEWEH
ncbi:hypothetical protein CCAX7_001370 [Capsulimonas corticalis]|uniref:Uncharacterized protein n=1 Tax=Capsulimonas corticalis TaxID=2219043 RepID=A0A402CRW8_9BACT|nr:hypothetical protein [Capsulimonas corticalis]BDI28086.1 hypothetical protein CCAX7_001370 [Capsulimonas corticalis]